MKRKSQLTKSKSNHSFKGKDNRFSIWLKTFCKGFGLLLTYEIIEELIEEAIAYTITTIIAKAVSFILVVVLTQTVKVTAKGLAKGITVVLKPAVKKLTYKEGNDKVNKLLRFINMCKEKIQNNKFLNFLKRNPKSILGILVGVGASVASGGATTCGLIVGDVQLPLWAEICIGVVICIVLAIPICLGVNGAGFENATQSLSRKLAETFGVEKAYDAILKAKQDFDAEEEATAKAAEEKAETDRIELEKRMVAYADAWNIEVSRKTTELGFDEYVEKKEAELAEVKAKQAAAEEERARENAKTAWIKAATTGGYKGSFEEWYAENK